MNNELEAGRIRDLLAIQVKAIREGDIITVTKNYAPEVLVFDVVGPLSYPRGDESVKDRLSAWLSSFSGEKGIGFEMIDLLVTAGQDLAFSHSINHVNGQLKNGSPLDMYWRETLNWLKIEGNWKIVHAHSSVPFDPMTGQASTGLKPL